MSDPATSSATGGRRVVLLLFFASGLSALIYQVIWLRSLSTVFGSTVYATTTVLASSFRIGALLLKKREVARGREEMRRCLEVLPTHKDALAVSATIDLNSRNYADARRSTDKLLQLYPGDDAGEKLRHRLHDAGW